MAEHLLSTNQFNKTKVLTGRDEIAVKLTRLLIMEPGQNPLHPEMGVDIVGRYLYCSEEDLDDLRDEIRKQVITYMPEYQQVTVSPSIVSRKLRISIVIDDSIYNFTTSSTPDSLSDISLISSDT